jgi:hypothetical protein
MMANLSRMNSVNTNASFPSPANTLIGGGMHSHPTMGPVQQGAAPGRDRGIVLATSSHALCMLVAGIK